MPGDFLYYSRSNTAHFYTYNQLSSFQKATLTSRSVRVYFLRIRIKHRKDDQARESSMTRFWVVIQPLTSFNWINRKSSKAAGAGNVDYE
jgi:hypothetical protein